MWWLSVASVLRNSSASGSKREPDAGMKVIGVCLPSAELPRPVIEGVPVLGNLSQVAEVVRAMGCDAVAVTSDDATRYNYLRELAWSLEGAGVELLVDPGLVEVAGPRMHIRPLMGFPLLHVEEPHFTGARKGLHLLQSRGHSLRHVVVVGSFRAAQQLSKRIQEEPAAGMKVIGVCLPSVELPMPVIDGVPVLGNLGQVADVVNAMACDAVAVTSDDATRHNYLRELAWSLEGAGVELLVDPGLVEVAGPRMHIRPLMGFPLLHVEEPHFTGWRRVVKRASDIVLTSIGLVIISPFMLFIAAVIKLQDGGPVIFRQSRVGRGGKPFTMLKFRSMVVDAEDRKLGLMSNNEGKGGLFKLSRDPRVTPLGQFLRNFSLDELPQLFNVLAGSMSLVGPRPHLASELAQMPSEASRRSLVTPGLTGLWQVSGRSDLEGDDAIRLDLRYVENWSLALDLLILCKTISAVLDKRGAA